ncbi:polysaccharide biosynthesis/export family protein [Vibrio sinaloensis]|nr:polysaccharide biosynthesis/export family protein [Vibrio sinaloensis]
MRRIMLLVMSVLWLSQASADVLDDNQIEASKPMISQRDVSQDYHLGTGDRISISVYGEDDMSMDLKIGKSGVVSFTYIGEVQLTGRTPSEIETEIEDRLRGDYVLNPMVTVSLESFRLFYIAGEVKLPNGYEYQPRMTVEQAIAMAGGFTDRADESDIRIRSGADSHLIEDVELTDPVKPGDTVIIEQSFF